MKNAFTITTFLHFGFNVFNSPNQICLGCNVFSQKMNEITSTLFICCAKYLSYLSIVTEEN